MINLCVIQASVQKGPLVYVCGLKGTVVAVYASKGSRCVCEIRVYPVIGHLIRGGRCIRL